MCWCCCSSNSSSFERCRNKHTCNLEYSCCPCKLVVVRSLGEVKHCQDRHLKRPIESSSRSQREYERTCTACSIQCTTANVLLCSLAKLTAVVDGTNARHIRWAKTN